MHAKNKNLVNKKRRRFLGLSLTGGGVAFIAGIKGRATQDSATVENHKAQPSHGYRVTEHIKKYYLKARN